MALDDGDKAICAEIAREIVEKVSSNVMQIHLDTCPHGKLLSKTRNLIIGACIGSSIGSGSLILLVGKLIAII